MKNKSIGVVGLGYVGLPLAVVMSESGYDVIGYDIQEKLCNQINNGISHIKDIDSNRLKKVVTDKKFIATSKFESLKNCDAISICVPTPLNKIKDPDLSYVISATEKISSILKKGHLIILESTTYPGTTKDLMLPILEKSKLKIGVDFNLCFSPERVDPGNIHWNTKNTPKIIGGITDNCLNAGVKLYETIFDKIVPVENTEAAELVKVYENTFRMINIALANELSQICDKLNINVWRVIDAASTKPFGFMKFTPGPGLGGHCIPLDPHYLSWKMRTLSFKTKMIEIASEINAGMPLYTIEKIGRNLNMHQKSFKNSKILILGIAYKKNIDDLRESPALDIISLLEEREAEIYYYDKMCPIINDDGHTKIKKLPMISINTLNKEAIQNMDCVVVITDHDDIDYEEVNNISKIFIDMRGVLKKDSSLNDKI